MKQIGSPELRVRKGVTFLREFREAGFSDAVILRQSRNARTKDPHVLAAEVRAIE
jgi:hypothetical protein